MSDGVAQASAEVLNEMLAKHPQASATPTPTGPVPQPMQFVVEDVVRALRSFSNGTATGPSSLRANHLNEAVFCSSQGRATYVLQKLCNFISVLSAGRVPSAGASLLCGATLFACKKKGGGLRPIAVGEVLHRLTSKCISCVVQAQAIGILSPLQLGVGVPVDCEAIVHSVDRVLEDPGIQPDAHWTLFLDFSNAFNSVSREVLFREVRAHLPSMSAWIECCYSPQPLLTLVSSIIYSCCGVQQGDPLGPLGFAFALHPIIKKVREKVPGLVINAWYLDDGTLCGSPRNL